MRRYLPPLAAAFIGTLAAPTAALAQDAIVTMDLNMRAGPSPEFPVVDVLPGNTPVDIHGCLAGYSWCDVSTESGRGWVYSAYLSYAAEGGYVPLVQYVSEIDVPIVTFSVGPYWDSYYRNRPWYVERSRWSDRWEVNWRDYRWDRRDDRADGWRERRVHRFEDRGDRGVDRVERRADRREAVQVRRVERQGPRVDRGDGRVDRSRDQMRQFRMEDRGAPRPSEIGDRSQRLDRGGRARDN